MLNETARLRALLDYNILDTSSEPQFDDIVSLACKLCDTPVALVSFVETDRQWFKARVGFEGCETPISQSVCAHAIREHELLVIPDLTKDSRTADNALVIDAPYIRFYAGAVLRTREGHPLGTVCVIDNTPRPDGLTAGQIQSLLALARQTMALMELRSAVVERDDVLTRFLQAQEVGQIGIFDLNLRNNECTVSPELCRLFGTSVRAQVPIEELQSLVLSEDRHLISTLETRKNGNAVSTIEVRLRRAVDGAVRWIMRRAEFRLDGNGTPVRMVGIIQDVTEQKLYDQRQKALIELGENLRQVSTIADAEALASATVGETLDATRSGYGVVDLQSNEFTSERDWSESGLRSLAGRHSLDNFPVSLGRLKRGMTITIDDIADAGWLAGDADGYQSFGIAAHISVPILQDHKLVGVLFVNSNKPRQWSASEVAFVQSVADQTHATVAKLRAEEHQRLLNQELSHRLKNTLAMVQSIASQTLRRASDPSAFKAFSDRLHVLSTSHDILLQESWSKARIMAIAEFALRAFRDRVHIVGPDLSLAPKAALSLALILHELATNAAKYGSFSSETGQVDLSWWIETAKSAEGEPQDPAFVLCWSERGGPPVSPPVKLGLGTRLIEMGLPGTDKADLRYDKSGFSAKIRATLPTILAD
jgi:two-component sensor histidine kinase/PAS domain-containing protein